MTGYSKAAVKLGQTGPAVFPIGLGCMGMSGLYGATDDAESIATIQAAIDAGVNLLIRVISMAWDIMSCSSGAQLPAGPIVFTYL